MLFPSKAGGVGGECKYTHTWVHTFADADRTTDRASPNYQG